jgi:hypothetical protein
MTTASNTPAMTTAADPSAMTTAAGKETEERGREKSSRRAVEAGESLDKKK